jgi:hypothetical protein
VTWQVSGPRHAEDAVAKLTNSMWIHTHARRDSEQKYRTNKWTQHAAERIEKNRFFSNYACHPCAGACDREIDRVLVSMNSSIWNPGDSEKKQSRNSLFWWLRNEIDVFEYFLNDFFLNLGHGNSMWRI